MITRRLVVEPVESSVKRLHQFGAGGTHGFLQRLCHALEGVQHMASLGAREERAFGLAQRCEQRQQQQVLRVDPGAQ